MYLIVYEVNFTRWDDTPSPLHIVFAIYSLWLMWQIVCCEPTGVFNTIHSTCARRPLSLTVITHAPRPCNVHCASLSHIYTTIFILNKMRVSNHKRQSRDTKGWQFCHKIISFLYNSGKSDCLCLILRECLYVHHRYINHCINSIWTLYP